MGSKLPETDICQVSIIVVNWNGKSFLDVCLSSALQQSYHSYEIILVDNGSTDGSVEFVRQNFPKVKVVELRENRGFAGGNNKGVEVAQGDCIALLNNDTQVHNQWLENLVPPMLNDPTIGICSSKILIENSGKIDSAGDALTTWGVGVKRGFGEEPHRFETPEFVFGACAAAALYSKKMIEDIGFLDEDFFFNDEDTDLNFRAQLRGWKCMYVPSALVYHKVNATIGRLSDRHVYFHARNLEFLWMKNMPGRLMIRFAHHKIIQEIGSVLYLCLRHKKWKPFFQAKRDVLRMLPLMLRKRKEIQMIKTMETEYIRSLFLPVFCKEFLFRKLKQFING